MPRRKNAAEKVFDPQDPGKKNEYALHGKFADDPLLNVVLEASRLNWELPGQCQADAEKQSDPEHKARLLETGEFMRDSIAGVVNLLSVEIAKAIGTGNSDRLRSLADLVDHVTAGTANNPPRHILLSCYNKLLKLKRRPPTANELNGADLILKRMGRRHFDRLCKELRIDCTPQKLIDGIKKRADDFLQKNRRPPTVIELRATTSNMRLSRELAPFSDGGFAVYAESAGVLFDPREALRHHYRFLRDNLQRKPSAK